MTTVKHDISGSRMELYVVRHTRSDNSMAKVMHDRSGSSMDQIRHARSGSCMEKINMLEVVAAL